LLLGYFVGNDLQMWENRGICLLFGMQVMQFGCVKMLQFYHVEENA